MAGLHPAIFLAVADARIKSAHDVLFCRCHPGESQRSSFNAESMKLDSGFRRNDERVWL
jgi:hypothetical protein